MTIPHQWFCGAADGGVKHAVAVVGKLVFDSSCEHAMPLCRETLDWCCVNGYDGIKHAIQFLPRSKSRRKWKRKRGMGKKLPPDDVAMKRSKPDLNYDEKKEAIIAGGQMDLEFIEEDQREESSQNGPVVIKHEIHDIQRDFIHALESSYDAAQQKQYQEAGELMRKAEVLSREINEAQKDQELSAKAPFKQRAAIYDSDSDGIMEV